MPGYLHNSPSGTTSPLNTYCFRPSGDGKMSKCCTPSALRSRSRSLRDRRSIPKPVGSRAGAHPYQATPNTPAELLGQTIETAFIDHVIKWQLFWKERRRLNPQVQPLDLDLAVGAITRNDQDAKPVDAALKDPIGFFADLHSCGCVQHLYEDQSSWRLASICARRPSRKGGNARPFPRSARLSSTANPGPSVASSMRT
jgi:hypothetical protein